MKALKSLLLFFVSLFAVVNFLTGCSETVKPNDDNDSTATTTCPTGYIFNEENNGCDLVPTCATGTVLDTTTNTCVNETPTCATGYSLDTTTNTCVQTANETPTCSSGQVLDTKTNTCVDETPTCQTGYSLDTSTNTCVQDTPTITSCGGQNQVTHENTGISSSYTCTEKYIVNQYIEIYNSNCEQTEEPDLCGYYEIVANSIDSPPSFPSIDDECENIVFCTNE